MHTTKTGKQIKTFLNLFVSGLILTLLSACQSQQIYQQRFLQFGTIIDITLVTTDQDKALQLYDKIEQLLKKRHTEWHGWQDGTLKQFNLALQEQAKTNSPKGIVIPEILQLLIQQSKNYHVLSDGLFNPAMGKLIAAWGFHQQSTPDLTLIDRLKRNIPGMHDLIINNNHAITLNPDLQLDFGAIAKGLMVKQLSQLINHHQIENFIINAGGDIYAQGQKQHHNWLVAIENPFYADSKTDRVIGSISIQKPMSVFTSGNYQRFYLDENNKRRHHIIDPISGEPSVQISAITVLHEDPVLADIAATTLMLTPIPELKNMAKKLKIKNFLAISEQHELYISPSMKQKINWLDTILFPTHLL